MCPVSLRKPEDAVLYDIFQGTCAFNGGIYAFALFFREILNVGPQFSAPQDISAASMKVHGPEATVLQSRCMIERDDIEVIRNDQCVRTIEFPR